MTQTTVLGIYKTREFAEDAITRLQELGYNPRDISIVMKDRAEGEALAHNTGADVAGGAVSGLTTGAVVGGLAGLLASLVIPGLGAFFIGGPIAAALGLSGTAAATVSGAATGAAAGGLIGGLMGMGLPEEDARRYQQHVEEGAILVAVPTVSHRTHEVETVFADSQATDVKAVAMKAPKAEGKEADIAFEPDFVAEHASEKTAAPQTAEHMRHDAGEVVNPIQVQKFLKNVDYPATKEELVTLARQKGADKNVLYTLEELPEKKFESPIAVSNALGKIE